MEMTVEEARGLRELLQGLAGETIPAPAKVQVHRHVQALADPLEPYDETRRGLIEEYGNGLRIPPEDEEAIRAFMVDWSEVSGDTIEVDRPDPIPASEIGDAEVETNILPLIEHGVVEDDL